MTNQTIEERHDEHLKLEPVKSRKLFYDDDRMVETSEHIKWRIINDNLKGVRAIKPEKRKQMMERFRKGGISVGEVAKEFNESSEAMSNLLYYNIKQTCYLGEGSV